eukprot:SM000078S22104  [mRNA]  locus=s78:466263:469898:- [translate_table: standard]
MRPPPPPPPPQPSRQRDLELLRLAFPDIDADVVQLVLDSCDGGGGEDVAEAARQLALLTDTAGPSQPALPLGRYYRKSSNDDTGGGKKKHGDWKRERAVHRLVEAFPNLSIHFIANVYEDAGKDAENAATILSSWQYARPLEGFREGSLAGCHDDDPQLADDQSRKHLREESGTPSGSQVAGEVPAVALQFGDEAPTVPAKGATLAFLRSMLGPDAAIKDDIIMDVLDHFDGDALKSWEVLLNLSASPATLLGHANLSSSPEQPQVVNALGSHNQTTLEELQYAFPSTPPKLLEEVLTASWGSYRIAYRTLCSFGLEPALVWTSDSELTAAFPTLSEAARGYHDVITQAEFQEHSNYEKRQRDAGDNQEWRPVEEAGQLRYYCYQEARRAWSRGKKLQAQSLMEMASCLGHVYKEKMCRVIGSQTINGSIERNSTSKQVLNLDLHEHCVEEAINLLEMHLKYMLKLCQLKWFKRLYAAFTFLKVITGWGRHSAGGQAKVKPAVLRYLKETGIGYTEENLGAYLIHRRDIERAEAPVTAGRSSLADFLRAPS